MTAKILRLPFLALSLLPSLAHGNCLLPHDSSQPSHWTWALSTHYQALEMESIDDYFSGPGGMEDWRARHNLDGDFAGFTLAASPPILGNMITGFFSYQSGDLKGVFDTQEISPFPEGPYPGTVSFDRESWELGADIAILNAVYARFAYTHYDMDGTWDYGDPFTEPQKYEFDAFEIGAGFRQDYQSCYSPNLTFGVDAYLGLLIFEHEHTEIDTSAKAKSEGVGFHARLEANAKYKLATQNDTRVVAGVGYDYQNLDDDGVDLTNEGFFARLGVEFGF